jgi:hypothetical protein
VRGIVEPDRFGGLDLNLPEPRLLEPAKVVAPDEVIGVLGRELAHVPDPHPQRRALHRQPPVFDEQVLERLLLRIGLIEESGRLDHELRRGGKSIESDQIVPLGPLAEVKHGDRIEQPRLRPRKLDGLGAQALLQQPLTPPESLVHLAARGHIVGRELVHALVTRLVARLDDPADLVNGLVVVWHGNSPILERAVGRGSCGSPSYQLPIFATSMTVELSALRLITRQSCDRQA